MVAMPKLDGLSLTLVYEGGWLAWAATRGNDTTRRGRDRPGAVTDRRDTGAPGGSRRSCCARRSSPTSESVLAGVDRSTNPGPSRRATFRPFGASSYPVQQPLYCRTHRATSTAYGQTWAELESIASPPTQSCQWGGSRWRSSPASRSHHRILGAVVHNGGNVRVETISGSPASPGSAMSPACVR